MERSSNSLLTRKICSLLWVWLDLLGLIKVSWIEMLLLYFTLISFLSSVIYSKIQLLICFNNENFRESPYIYFHSRFQFQQKNVPSYKWVDWLSGLFGIITWASKQSCLSSQLLPTTVVMILTSAYLFDKYYLVLVFLFCENVYVNKFRNSLSCS